MAKDDKELKDQRVVTMMSPSELEAIDDWMFKNRIRSRGEAIRRLCQVGLKLDEVFDDTRLSVWDLLRFSHGIGRVMARRLAAKDMDAETWGLWSIVNVLRLRDRVDRLIDSLGQAVGTLRKMREVDDIGFAFVEATRIQEENLRSFLNKDQIIKLDQWGSKLPPELNPSEEDMPPLPPQIEKLKRDRGED